MLKTLSFKCCTELLCPLDRQIIDVTRVFKDKFNERRVLNLTVKCKNFGDECNWTGELRHAVEHETSCSKNDTMLNNSLEQLIDRMTKIELSVKCHEQKHAEKDIQIKNQNEQIENQQKQIEDQKKQIVKINNQCLSMIIPNIADESNYSPLCTAFQWKFSPAEVKSNGDKYSPPFYNIMNAHCFQLKIEYAEFFFKIDHLCNGFYISLKRYRGKYDHNVRAIKEDNNINFQIHIFGKNGKMKVFEWDSVKGIPKYKAVGEDTYRLIEHSDIDIDRLTIDGYIHLHCFFNKTM